ncbi:hypothetical protein DTO013E5_8955 [Penicillium roqueforti]|uniref:uncharacterized protein n=1 Tax=Penicillium roqueforti TaxID=5082 RepID=UPI00190B2F6F|nr:uncharacterized protein LCP9604111_9166 [Penicillium roqueforti]KAF9239401.1 hypothetical protein LCP9604111_9166 [Penicillium roqueforti]KAI1835854.1 hypothetical protein CBS147337_3003 [Penicillium roqueforti]KAI2670757.1 hypothetical protein CBS147355_9092 [Penicillium roqueforti]KAI2684159.1 hypothetical protein LCP963914a_5459 [Penicillium roqueforti]KAI2697761.1 hypothetical protein CBS147332_8744 [Penicillium roqueforti]
MERAKQVWLLGESYQLSELDGLVPAIVHSNFCPINFRWEPEKRCNYIGAVHFLATRPAMTGLENVVTFR